MTLLASVLPALRATRVPPLAALRDIAVDRSDLSRFRIGVGLVGLAVGAYELSASLRHSGSSSALPTVGIGAGLMVISFLVIGPVVAGRSIRVLGLPLPSLTGVTGKLATENAARSPKRTSATVSAVVIGVALVVFITAFAASAERSVRTEVERGVAADFIVTHKQQGLTFGIGMPTTVAATVKTVPGVDVVAALGFGTIGIAYPDGKTASHLAESIDPAAVATVFHPRTDRGVISALTDDGIVLDQSIVKQHHMQIGDRVTVTGAGGRTKDVRLQVISNDPTLLGLIALSTPTFASINPGLVDVQVGGTVKAGADLPTVLKAMRHALARRAVHRRARPRGLHRQPAQADHLLHHARVRPPGAVGHHRAGGDREHAVAVDQRADAASWGSCGPSAWIGPGCGRPCGGRRCSSPPSGHSSASCSGWCSASP